MKQVIFTLICITIVSLSSGCASKSNRVEYIPVEITAPIVQCHTDEELKKIEYEILSSLKHIGSEENQDIIQSNILKLKSAYSMLYASVICYDKQVKKSKELNEKQSVEFNKIKEGK